MQCRLFAAATMISVFALTPVVSLAQEDLLVAEEIEQSRAINEAKRQATITANVTFTTEEMGKFWPLYWEYRSAVGAIDEEYIRLIKDYAKSYQSMSNREARKLTEAYVKTEIDRANLKEEYVKKFETALPAAKTMRVMQIESKLDIMVRAAITKQVPLVVPRD